MSDWEQRVQQATTDVENALSHALYDLNGSCVVKFVASFEYLDTDGERLVASMASPGLMKWDVAGLLHYILRNDELDSIRQVIEGPDA